MLFYNQSVEEVYAELRTQANGLSRHEVTTRLKTYGPNSLRIKGEPLWRKLVEPFANVFMLVLFIATIISLLHHAYIDAVIIVSIMLISALIYYVQRFSTERILRSLQKHSVQRIEVVRGGETVTIEDSQLVPGDIVRLNEGDKIPADIRITIGENIRADESILTGESLPINKSVDALAGKKQVYEQTNLLFRGSFLVGGQATGVVIRTGNQTEFGKIAALTGKGQENNQSPVQKKIDKLLTYIIAVVAAIAVIAFILALVRGIEFTEALQFVMALSVSAVPESLPVAISVILVLGMRRMAAKKALVRTMRSIETIGVITTIATDKTGTLTKNKLSVQEFWQPSGIDHHLPTIAQRTINHLSERARDPLDIAMIEFTAAQELVALKGEAVKKLPFDQAFSMSGNIWHHKGRYDLTIKGAPEKVLERSNLPAGKLREAEAVLQRLTSQGYRVIAVATTKLDRPLEVFQDMHKKLSFDFVGFLAVADTLRPTARRAIMTAQNAGVSVRMITGDHFETAFHIGQQLGLVTDRSQVFDSRQMDDMNDRELGKKVADARVFSRVTPENKFRILQLLKAKEITAMTGDGVNDVPALSSAHVGLAMGSGSQIAKDAGDIILLNDNFASIVRAMREGRIIFSNIRRMLLYLLSTNTGEVIVSIGALIVGMPVPLMPVQILWVNLVTDTTMVIPLGLEPGEKGVMKQKPTSPKAPLLGRYLITRLILVALTMGIVTLGMYAYFYTTHGVEYAQTIAFNALVVMQWANAFNARSTFESIISRIRVFSKTFYIGLAIGILLQVLAIVGPLQSLLHVYPVDMADLLITGTIAFIIPIITVEIHKLIGRRLMPKALESEG